MKVFFGVDVGGTEIKIGAFSPEGDLLEKWSRKTDLSDNGNRVIPDVAANVCEYVEKHQMSMEDVAGIGIGIPGPVDRHGNVKVCVNLHWTNFNPVTELKKFFPDLPIAAGNDANVAALGEYYKGSGKGSASMMMVTLGTGVGGGIIIDGNIIHGANAIGGEIGHIAVNREPLTRCNCGNLGCVDECASATGIVRYAKHYLETETTPSGLRDLDVITAKDVCDQAKAGDVVAMKTMKKCMGVLAEGMALFSHAFDPEVYVLGGGVSHAGQWLIDLVAEEYHPHFHLIPKGADIRLAQLGNDAGIIGACMLVAAK